MSHISNVDMMCHTLILYLSLVVTAFGLEIKIGALLTVGRCCDFLSFEDKASAFNIAIDQLREDGVLDDSVTFKYTQFLGCHLVVIYHLAKSFLYLFP